MKKSVIVSVVIGLAIFNSCSQSPKTSNKKPETPKALQDNNSSTMELISKKRYEADLVDALYEELTTKDPALKDLENRINNLTDTKADSLAEFVHYKSKNESYYASAKNHASGIQDSILRQKIKMMIENSESKFNNKISAINDLVSHLKKNDISIKDAHIFLKIILTDPVMVKYQNENMASSKPIESAVKESDDVLKKVTALGGN